MPFKIASPCSAPGCPRVAVARGRCTEHARAYVKQSNDRYNAIRSPEMVAEYRSPAYVRARREMLARQPYCACGERAVIGHHLVPGDHSTLVPVCPACHNRLHKRGWAKGSGQTGMG